MLILIFIVDVGVDNDAGVGIDVYACADCDIYIPVYIFARIDVESVLELMQFHSLILFFN